jgi:hypothetical protein
MTIVCDQARRTPGCKSLHHPLIPLQKLYKDMVQQAEQQLRASQAAKPQTRPARTLAPCTASASVDSASTVQGEIAKP